MGRRPGNGALGEQETELLRFVAEQDAALTVREAVASWGEPRSLARTTVLTMLERLREKGHLVRERSPEDSWAYRPVRPRAEVLSGLVQSFVERTLGGSVSPFVSYLAEGGATLTADERAKLKALLETLD
jgi:predicted transcriptional regulator